jgi:3-oxoadipate enol-lactonase
MFRMIKSVLVFLFIISSSLSPAQVAGSGYVSVSNDKIFFESAGSGNVIILIHDGLVHRELWDNQFSYFSKNFKVIRYDRRGYGNSFPAIGTYSNLDDLDALFTQLKIDSACLIGSSSGGALAIDFALKFPHKVTSLVLVGAVVGGLSYTSHFTTRGGHMPKNLKDDRMASIYLITEDPYEIYSENSEAREKALNLIKNNPPRVYSASRNVTDSLPAYRRLNEIKVPTLIIVGEFDIPDVHAHAGAINAGILNSRRIIIPGSGHLVPMEQPALFNDAVKDFLKLLPGND